MESNVAPGRVIMVPETEIKRLEGLVEGRDAEIDRLSRGWDASIAELDEERTWREGLSDLSITQQLEIERLRAVVEAARAYCDVPIDDPDAGALYRALVESLRRPTHDE